MYPVNIYPVYMFPAPMFPVHLCPIQLFSVYMFPDITDCVTLCPDDLLPVCHTLLFKFLLPRIILLFDAHKLDISDEFKNAIQVALNIVDICILVVSRRSGRTRTRSGLS